MCALRYETKWTFDNTQKSSLTKTVSVRTKTDRLVKESIDTNDYLYNCFLVVIDILRSPVSEVVVDSRVFRWLSGNGGIPNGGILSSNTLPKIAQV